MRRLVGNFAHDENGAISVDWVVLTAGLVGLAVLVLSVFSDSLTALVEYIRINMIT